MNYGALVILEHLCRGKGKLGNIRPRGSDFQVGGWRVALQADYLRTRRTEMNLDLQRWNDTMSLSRRSTAKVWIGLFRWNQWLPLMRRYSHSSRHVFNVQDNSDVNRSTVIALVISAFSKTTPTAIFIRGTRDQEFSCESETPFFAFHYSPQSLPRGDARSTTILIA